MWRDGSRSHRRLTCEVLAKHLKATKNTNRRGACGYVIFTNYFTNFFKTAICPA